MKSLLGIVFIGIMLIAGCESTKPLTAASASPVATPTVITTANPTSTPEVKQENISFEISSFNIDYKNNTSGYFNEEYTGAGIITTNGDQSLVKKPYMVLIQVTRKSGGQKNDVNSGVRSVIVHNGVGKFGTTDYSFERDYKMEKPIYDIKLIGYIPYAEIKQ